MVHFESGRMSTKIVAFHKTNNPSNRVDLIILNPRGTFAPSQQIKHIRTHRLQETHTRLIACE